MKTIPALLALLHLVFIAVAHAVDAPAFAARPNILWLIAEDMSPRFGCYGETSIEIPNIDRLAASGVLFERAFVTGPICSPSDMAATSLALAGISKPKLMQAHNVLAPDYHPRDAVFSARDRADETVDHIRSVRTERWKYIRNFFPNRPYLQPNNYKDNKPCLIALRAAEAAGLLDDIQRLIFAATRQPEELYDLEAEPWEVRNLAGDPSHGETLRGLRSKLGRWMEQTDDNGRMPESEARYDSEMDVYQGRKPNSDIAKNIALVKQWAREGR